MNLRTQITNKIKTFYVEVMLKNAIKYFNLQLKQNQVISKMGYFVNNRIFKNKSHRYQYNKVVQPHVFRRERAGLTGRYCPRTEN